MLASVGGERISLTPDTPTVSEIVPELDIALWNGLFVRSDTPQEVRDRIVAVAERTIASERVQRLAAETGALVYWQNAEEAAAQIEQDIATLGVISDMLE